MCAVPAPNPSKDPITDLTSVRYYTVDDPVYADTDNRPLADLRERDIDLNNKIGGASVALEILADKVGEDTTTVKGTPPVGPPSYSNHYVLTDGEAHNDSISNLSTESERMKNYSGKDNLAQISPVYSTKGSNEKVISDGDNLSIAVAKVDYEIEKDLLYSGKTNIGPNMPDYSGTGHTTGHYILDGDDLTSASAKLDKALFDSVSGSGMVEVGSVFWFIGYIPPVGYLESNGALLGMTAYSNLFAVISNIIGLDTGVVVTFNPGTDEVNAIGHTISDNDLIVFSNVGGALPPELGTPIVTWWYARDVVPGFSFKISSTIGGPALDIVNVGTGIHSVHSRFRIPDLRGEFIRGLDNGRGIDPGRGLGTTQSCEVQPHVHHYRTRDTVPGKVAVEYGERPLDANWVTNWFGYYPTDQIWWASPETRPKNVALMPIIKY